MALMTSLQQISENLYYGNRSDVCEICVTNIKFKTRDEYFEEKKKLVGALEGKPVLKITKNGLSTCICIDCIKKIAAQFPDKKEE